MPLPEILTTERLTLRPYRFQDVDAVFAYAKEPGWSRFLPVPNPYTFEDAEKFVASAVLQERSKNPSWAIVFEDAVAGGINIRLDLVNRIGEIGYSVAVRLWGRGIATEASRALISAAFAEYPELLRVRAHADSRNIASQRVMEKCGMRKEGVLRKNRMFKGESIDEAWFGILRDELSANSGL